MKHRPAKDLGLYPISYYVSEVGVENDRFGVGWNLGSMTQSFGLS